MYINKELERMFENVAEREKKRCELLKHRRNVAAIVDFASSVLRSKKPASQSHGADCDSYVLKCHCSPIRDYKGTVACEMFRKRFSLGKNKTIKK